MCQSCLSIVKVTVTGAMMILIARLLAGSFVMRLSTFITELQLWSCDSRKRWRGVRHGCGGRCRSHWRSRCIRYRGAAPGGVRWRMAQPEERVEWHCTEAFLP